MKGLAKHGHQVDVISHYSLKVPPKNYRHIVNLAGMQTESMNNVTLNFAFQIADAPTRIIARNYGNVLCDLMGLEEIQKLVKNPPKDPPYDIVITEVSCLVCNFLICT